MNPVAMKLDTLEALVEKASAPCDHYLLYMLPPNQARILCAWHSPARNFSLSCCAAVCVVMLMQACISVHQTNS